MEFLLDGIREAWRLVVSGDRTVFHAVYVSLACSITAVTLAAIVAIPYGGWLGLRDRRGRGVQIFLLRVGMFVPTVAIGLLVFVFVSRRGLLGGMDLLYTRTAIVAGEVLLAFPLMAMLAHSATASLDRRVPETARTLGAGRLRTLLTTLGEVRMVLIAAYLLAFARCVSELGIAVMVGGNLKESTRTLTTTIALEISKGDFGLAMACCVILMLIAVVAALFAHRIGGAQTP